VTNVFFRKKKILNLQRFCYAHQSTLSTKCPRKTFKNHLLATTHITRYTHAFNASFICDTRLKSSVNSLVQTAILVYSVCVCVCVRFFLCVCDRHERECLFQSHSQWFIPISIPNPRFSRALFPFPSHSHWLFLFSPALIPVLILVSHQITKWPVNSTMYKTELL